MKDSELMIGDWIYLEGIPSCVVGIKSGELTIATSRGHVDIRPRLYPECVAFIPITPEILEKNDFVRRKGGSYQWNGPGLYCAWRKGRLNIRQWATLPMQEVHVDCTHVHQLQHSLRLVGIEKEIQL